MSKLLVLVRKFLTLASSPLVEHFYPDKNSRANFCTIGQKQSRDKPEKSPIQPASGSPIFAPYDDVII